MMQNIIWQGPIPDFVEKALEEARHNTEAHRQLYLRGHSCYSPHLECMVLTEAGRDYHVELLLGRLK